MYFLFVILSHGNFTHLEPEFPEGGLPRGINTVPIYISI